MENIDWAQFEINDDSDKNEVMSVFEKIYDAWIEKEIKNVKSGKGRCGMAGMMTQDIEALFNQLMVVLYYNSKK